VNHFKKALGNHVLADFYGCSPEKISNVQRVREILVEAALQANATILTEHFHQFEPHGVSGVIVISESHITIHTWPEHGCAAVDLFTCSPTVDEATLIRVLQERLGATHASTRSFERGTGLAIPEVTPQEEKWRPEVPLR